METSSFWTRLAKTPYFGDAGAEPPFYYASEMPVLVSWLAGGNYKNRWGGRISIPPEGNQREKVGVARSNVRRSAAHGKFEKLVVFRITASRNPYINLNPFGLARQSRQKASNIFLICISTEFFPAEANRRESASSDKAGRIRFAFPFQFSITICRDSSQFA